MNKAKRARWCNSLQGAGAKEGRLRFWVLKLPGRRREVGAREARAVGRVYNMKTI